MNNRYRRKKPYKDASLIVIATEGRRTEYQYFSSLKDHSNYKTPKIIINVIEKKDDRSSPTYVLKQIKEFKKKWGTNSNYEDHYFIVVDRDNWTEGELSKVSQDCKKIDINICMSNPRFEFWLVLHFIDYF